MAVATTAPAVPGPQGQKPAPKPVPMNTGMMDGRFIMKCKSTFFFPNFLDFCYKKT